MAQPEPKAQRGGGPLAWIAGAVGALLLVDALCLIGQRMFNVGVLVPLAFSAAGEAAMPESSARSSNSLIRLCREVSAACYSSSFSTFFSTTC